MEPEKLLGKDFFLVKPKLDDLNIKYRVVRKNGLITADFVSDRMTIEIDENDIITNCAFG